MKFLSAKPTLLSAALLASMLSSCAKEQASVALGKTTEQGQTGAGGAGAEDWRQITTFAQSIESVKFTKTGQEIELNLQHRDFDKFDDKGAPYFKYLSPLKGQLNEKGEASLSNADASYTASVKCDDVECANATVEVSKLSGAVAGSAIIKHRSFVRTSLATAINFDSESGAQSDLEKKIIDSLNSNDPRQTTLNVEEVVAGRKTSFQLKVVFSNALLLKQDAGYFERKEIALSGETGSGVTAWLGQGTVLGTLTTSSASSYKADVRFDSSGSLLVATLFKKLASGEQKSGMMISAGNLFSQRN